MWFKTVPRLGAFMAVPLIYDACLNDEALEVAVADFQRVTAENERLKADLQAHDHEQTARYEAAVSAGEHYEKEVKELVQVEFQPFKTVESKFIVCLDTMGQDCEISEQHRRWVLNTIRTYCAEWERSERENLTMDRDRRV